MAGTPELKRQRDEAFELFAQLVIRSDPGRLEAWVGLGFTMTQLRVLFILREEPRLTAGVLAERLGVTPSTLTRLMDRLVRTGLVRREADPGDRRLVRHTLTEHAMASVEELERAGRARMNEVLERLSRDKLTRLVAGLRDLVEAADAVEAAGGQAVRV